jgi:methyl-accepting chemotaxis protein
MTDPVAVIAAIDWASTGAFLGGFAAVALLVVGTVKWANAHIAKPLRVVTGEAETADDPGKPSLYQLTKEAKETSEKALQIVMGNGNGTVSEVSDKALKISGRLEKKQAEMQLSLDDFHEKGSITAQKAGEAAQKAGEAAQKAGEAAQKAEEAAQKAGEGLDRIEALVREIDGSFEAHVIGNERDFAAVNKSIAEHEHTPNKVPARRRATTGGKA